MVVFWGLWTAKTIQSSKHAVGCVHHRWCMHSCFPLLPQNVFSLINIFSEYNFGNDNILSFHITSFRGILSTIFCCCIDFSSFNIISYILCFSWKKQRHTLAMYFNGGEFVFILITKIYFVNFQSLGLLLKLVACIVFISIFGFSNDQIENPRPVLAKSKSSTASSMATDLRVVFFGILTTAELFLLILSCCVQWHLVAFRNCVQT